MKRSRDLNPINRRGMQFYDGESMVLRPKLRHRSFYKSVTIITFFTLFITLQVGLQRKEESSPPAQRAITAKNVSALSQHLKQGQSFRKLLQTSEALLPPYCQNGGYGDPYDPLCPCDPTQDDACWCPIIIEFAYEEWPCGWDVVCQDIVLLNNTDDKCNFTKTTSYCAILEGFINYSQVVYCDFGDLIPLIMVILLVWWLFLFVSLAVCADDFFCTALVIIVKTLNLSPNVAGVTFLAFGNGAPDLFSAIAGFLDMKGGDAGLAVGGLFGAGFFVSTIIVGSVAVVKPFKVTERPFLRDNIFYTFAAFWMLWIIWRERIYLYDAIGFVLLYITYVVVVILSGAINHRLTAGAAEGEGKGISEIATTNKEGAKMLHFSSIDESKMIHSASVDSFDLSGNGQVAYENSGYMGDDMQDKTEMPDDAKQDKMQELSKKIQEEIDRERQNGDLRNGSMTGDETEKVSMAIIEEPKWQQFLSGINPINVEEWPDMPWYLKAYSIFKAPIMFLLTITVPVVNYDVQPLHNWNRPLQCFQCLIAPMFCAFLIGSGTQGVFGSSVPMAVPLLGLGAVLAILVFIFTEDYKIPKFHEAFGYMAFVVAMIWIFAIATEIVNLLTAFGVVLQLTNGILGLTLLAWGNSVGDFVSDMVMARQGFPRMAFSACFGAPIFHLCMGTGIPFIVRMSADGVTDMKVNMDTMLLMANLAVILSMLFSLVTLIITKFQANKFYGICLVTFYIVFLLICILTEAGVVPRELKSHVDI